ncbi:flagellar biosynthetic protein FliR [Persephonella sp.]
MNPLITPDMAVTFGLVLSRVIGVFLGFPLINTAMIPLNVRIVLTIAFSFFLMGVMDVKVSSENFSLLTYILLILRELLIGALLGLIVNIFIAAFSYAAELISYFMGFTIANLFDPTFGQISILDRFFILLFYLLFFITGAYQMVIGGLVMSFKLLPVGQLTFNPDIFPYILEKTPLIFYIGLKIAFPFILILFIVNVALALINRLIPQINVFIVGLPLQIFVGLAALAVATSLLIMFSISVINNLAETYIKAFGILGK